MANGKPVKVKYTTEITADGGIFVHFNQAVRSKKTKCYFTPEALFALAEEYGEIPETGFNDFPGELVVTEQAIFGDGEEEEDEDDAGDEGEDAEEEEGPEVLDADFEVKKPEEGRHGPEKE